MSNRCPKCNEKLSPFYMKQNCPKCDTNLVYYDLENRLIADHEQAMKEQEAIDRVLNNIKVSAFGGALQIIRFILMFSPLAWMCLPVVKTPGIMSLNMNVTLISVITDIINGSFSLNGIMLIGLVIMICIIVFSLMVIISSLFSVGEKALKRNTIFSIINLIVLLGCVIFCAVTHIANALSVGVALTLCTYILTIILHKLIDNKLNK